ncbi:MAG: DUF4836 family protein [Prevotellaceae bacterium]|jgi:hypothetical protein|nr:DUF4836 family protein [Prevotellaceae bacterium]
MNYFRTIFTLLIAGSLIFASCESKITAPGSAEQLALIPADAFFVADIKVGEMLEKSGLNKPDDYKFMAFAKFAGGEAYAFIEHLLKGSDDAGASLEQIVIYTAQNKTFGLSAKMLDKTAFEKWIVKLSLFPTEIKNSGSISYSRLQEDLCIVWNDKYLVLTSNDSFFEENQLKNLLKPRTDGLLAANDDFKRFAERSGDIRVWAQYGESINFLNRLSEAEIKQPVFNMDDDFFQDFKNIHMHASLEFNDGRIDGSMEMSPASEMEKIKAKYPVLKDKINPAILKDVPEVEYLALCFAVNMQEYYKYIKKMMDGWMAKSDSYRINPLGRDEIKALCESPDVKDVIDALDGDVFMGIHGFNQGAIPYPLANIVFTVKSEDAFKTIMNKIPKEMINHKNPKYFSIINKIVPVYFAFKNNRVLVTNDEKSIEGFTGNNPPAKTFADNAVKTLFAKPAAFYLNLDFASYPQFIKTLLANVMGYRYSQFVSYIDLYESFQLSGNYFKTEGSLTLKNKNVNVLKQILKNIDNNLNSFGI